MRGRERKTGRDREIINLLSKPQLAPARDGPAPGAQNSVQVTHEAGDLSYAQECIRVMSGTQTLLLWDVGVLRTIAYVVPITYSIITV